MESLTLNLTGKVRQVSEGGKDYLVAPVVLINPGVLPGSKGSLLYKPEDVSKSAPDWNGMPLLIDHPHDPITNEPLSAQDPKHGPSIIERQGVGEVRKSRFDGKHRGEAWFEKSKLAKVSPVILKKLQEGKQISVSTGLFTDNVDEAGSFNGRSYVAIARNFRPDHLAILPTAEGACSIKDGCGVLVNKASSSLQEKIHLLANSSLVINPDWVEDHDIWEKAKKAADKSDCDDDSYYAVVTSIYKNMGGGIKGDKVDNEWSEAAREAAAEARRNKHKAITEEVDKVELEAVHTGAMLERLKQGKRVMNLHTKKVANNFLHNKLTIINEQTRDELGRFASGSGGGSKGSGKGSAKVHGAAKGGHQSWANDVHTVNQGTHNMSSTLQDKLAGILGSVENADVKEDESVTKLKQADGSQTPLAPIGSSEQETELRLRDGGEVGSDEIDTEDHDMIEKGAESPLKADATALGAEEIKPKPFKKPEQSNAQTHNQEEGGHTMATVTLNAEEREAVVNGLIEGECCFEESERAVLNSLSDRTLARLTLNAKEMPKFIQDKIDAKKAKEDSAMEEADSEDEDEEEEVEEEEVENEDQKTEEKDRAGLGVRAGKGTGKNESQAQGNVKPCGELNPKMPTDNQLSADDRQFLAIGRKVVSDRRSDMIKTITANSRNPFDKKELASMEFNQLEKLSQLAAVESEAVVPSFTLNRFSGFMGAAAGVGQVNNDSGVDDDVLETPTINWSEVASKGVQKR